MNALPVGREVELFLLLRAKKVLSGVLRLWVQNEGAKVNQNGIHFSVVHRGKRPSLAPKEQGVRRLVGIVATAGWFVHDCWESIS